jgi:hypothetical protein
VLTDPRGVIHDDGMDHVVSCEEGGCGALDATGLANGYADNLDCKFCVAGSKEALDAVSFARMMRVDSDTGVQVGCGSVAHLGLRSICTLQRRISKAQVRSPYIQLQKGQNSPI